MRGELLNEVKNLSLKETAIVFENVKKLLLVDVKKSKKFNLDAIPNTTELITVTKEQYPELPFDEIEIINPKEFKEKVNLYHKLMVQAYYEGKFKTE